MDIHTSPVGWKVIGCAIEVHRQLGPGLLESPYERALACEFGLRAISFRQRHLGLRQGLLLNFNMPRLIDGLTSVLLPERSDTDGERK